MSHVLSRVSHLEPKVTGSFERSERAYSKTLEPKNVGSFKSSESTGRGYHEVATPRETEKMEVCPIRVCCPGS